MKIRSAMFLLSIAQICLGEIDPALLYPFPNAVGAAGSTAIHMNDSRFTGWADGYTNLVYGSLVDELWKTPQLALGHAAGGAYDIVCLGRGGQITLMFSTPIADGPEGDFAVFENAPADDFLELGWVEVSSDGEHFCRFPNYYGATNFVSTYGGHKTWQIYGLASKYRNGYGHPFDLSQLQEAYDALTPSKPSFFSQDYADALAANFPFLDLNNVTHVRIIDVIGDGSAKAANGMTIYDPYPTWGSAGFDLDAIGVIHQASVSGDPQSIVFDPIPHQKLAFGSVVLHAESDSGLPVSYSLQSGGATLAGNLLTFVSTGTVEVIANQPGDASYAPAAPVLRTFHVAEEIQHIFFEAVPNQIKGSGSMQLNAYASSGLPVAMEVVSGPGDVQVQTNLVLNLGAQAGNVRLRAFQPGDATYAPAEEVHMDFQIMEPGASNAPLSLAQWAASHAVPPNGLSDSDGDRAIDFQEFIMGGDPLSPSNAPLPSLASALDAYGRPSVILAYQIDRAALGRCRISQSVDLSSWTNAVPEILEQNQVGSMLSMKVGFPAETASRFYRLVFEPQ